VTEETRDARSNAEERATMEDPARRRQLGQTLVLVGILLLGTDLIAVAFLPSDIRSGHSFWTLILGLDVIVSISLVVIGTIMKAKAKSRLNV